MILPVKKLHEDAILPFRHYEMDACFDLYSIEYKTIAPLIPTIVRTGIAIDIPNGYEGVVRPRSSSFVKKNLDVYVGTIDAGYHGEVLFAVRSLGGITRFIEKGESVAQIAIREVPKIEIVEVDGFPATDRGHKGFGSTDKPIERC